MNNQQAPRQAQELRDFTDLLHSEADKSVVTTCTTTLPFPVKPEFEEIVTKFRGPDSTTIHAI